MYGDQGWCPSCGVPIGARSGPLALQKKGLPKPEGVWRPYWHDDVICLESRLAEEAERRFALQHRPVTWPRGVPSNISEVIIPVVGESWYEAEKLCQRALKHYGKPVGNRCRECEPWKWMPLAAYTASQLHGEASTYMGPIMASPEWFGDGFAAFRHVLLRRDVALFLESHGRRDFRIEELP